MIATNRTVPPTSQTPQPTTDSAGTSTWGSSADPMADALLSQNQLQDPYRDTLTGPSDTPDRTLRAEEGNNAEGPAPEQTVKPVASPNELLSRVSRLRGLLELDQSIAFSDEDISQISGNMGHMQKLMGAVLNAGDPPPLRGQAQEVPTPLVAATVAIPAPAIVAILEWIAAIIASITLVEVLVAVAIALLIIVILVAIERALERRASPQVDAPPEPEVRPDTETDPSPDPRATPRPNDRVQPIPITPDRPRSKWHRGNIHVQGDDIGSSTVPNFPWNRPVPMTKGEALVGLAALRGHLSRRQLALRDQAFVKAAKFIANTLAEAPPLVFRTFQNSNLIGNKDRTKRARVDIEIVQGVAFV